MFLGNNTIHKEPKKGPLKYVFQYQVTMHHHSRLEFTSTAGTHELAAKDREMVLSSLTDALMNKKPIVMQNSIGIQGDILAWFWVGDIEESDDSKGDAS